VNKRWAGGYLIGTDTGGTFTDCVVAGPHGLSIGKALSTSGELWRGILGAIEDATRDIGGLDEVLRQTVVLAHGTTAMLNATLTGTGSTVGIITTAGFEDTLAIGRVHQKVAGLAEWEMTDLSQLRKSMLFRDKRLIIGVSERVDAKGRVLQELDATEVKAAALQLRARGARAFAVNFLWSCANSRHEVEAAEIIKKEIPGARVSCSAELSPTAGEYERFSTCALNAYIMEIASGYLDTLADKLARHGFRGRLLVTRAWGDLERVERVAQNAVPSLFSGPIGGVVGARTMTTGHRAELPVVLCADIGGTSFDVAVIYEGSVRWDRRPTIERLHLSVPTFEVSSIGTGGGSTVRYDPELRLIQVGPQSAGGNPGPACYGRGGLHPTLTDAAVIAGWIPPTSRMPGGIALSCQLATEALERDIASPASMQPRQAAISVLRIACAQMADLVRKACIERAVDPRAAVLFVYGGAGAQYSGAICNDLGAKTFLVPELASAFSAFGMMGAEEGLVATRSANRLLPVEAEWFEQTMQELERDVCEKLDGNLDIALERFVELKYHQQINDLRLEIPKVPTITASLGEMFTAAYEHRYGAGTSALANQIELTAVVVRGSRSITHDRPLAQQVHRRSLAAAPSTRHRFLWVDGTEHEVEVHSFAPLRDGGVIRGPAILSENYTSIVVPPRWAARWRADVNMIEVTGDA
jgi:N-methylhydantoinase A